MSNKLLDEQGITPEELVMHAQEIKHTEYNTKIKSQAITNYLDSLIVQNYSYFI